MTPKELLKHRHQFILKKRKSPTEARMHPDDVIAVCIALGIGPDRIYGMRLIPNSDRERGDPLLTWSRNDS